MLELVICDDEKVYRNDLKKIVGTELDLSGISYRITEFDCGEALVNSAEVKNSQIIFLDIEMKHLDGIETARKIRLINKPAIIIFVTSHADFVFQGYEVRALDYILKPYQKEKILKIVHTALEELEQSPEAFYLIESRGKSLRLPLQQVKYFFSDKRSVTAVALDSSHVFYGKLNEVEQELPAHFVRIHNRYLININYLQSLEGSNAVIDSEMLPVSRAFKQELSIAFAKYMLR